MIAVSTPLIILMLTAAAPAQDTVGKWNQNLTFDLLLTEGYYANWSGDERSYGSLNAQMNHIAAGQMTERTRYEHKIDIAFGQQIRQDSVTGSWRRDKSDDRIQANELLRFTLGAFVDPLVSFQFKSQFVDSRDSVGRYLNPLEMLETVGVGRRFFDDSTRTLSSQLGASCRQSFDGFDTLGMVVDAGVSMEALFRTVVFSKNAEYSTTLVVYKPLVVLGGSRTVGRWPQVDWQHKLSARFTTNLSGNINVLILGEDNPSATGALVLRLKQTLGMGLSLAWPTNS